MGHTVESLGAKHVPSGKLGAALSVALPVSLVAAAVLSLAYAYLLVYIPIGGYISLLIVAGYALLLGVVTAVTARMSSCRSPSCVAVLGLVVGLFGLYCAWVSFEFVMLRRFGGPEDVSLLDLALSPVVVWGLATDISADGWYTIMSMTPSGAALWTLWGIEALLVVVGPAVIAYGSAKDQVFCESCHAWCDSTSGDKAPRLQVPLADAQLEKITGGGIDELSRLPAAGPNDSTVLRVQHWLCPKCNQTAALKVENVVTVAGAKGEKKETVKQVTPILLATPALIASLAAVGQAR